MIDLEKLRSTAIEALEAEGAFLVELNLGADNRISLSADHPEGITLDKLRKVSKAIEAEFDREQEDFDLEVSSPGVGKPLMVPQQYEMSVGRAVKITMLDGEIKTGDVKSFKDNCLTIGWKERVPKEIGKGKMTVSREEEINLKDIKETRLEIRF